MPQVLAVLNYRAASAAPTPQPPLWGARFQVAPRCQPLDDTNYAEAEFPESQGTTCPSGGILHASLPSYRGGAVTPPTPCRWRSDVAGGGGGGGDGRESGSGSSSGCAAPDVGCSRCCCRSGRCSGPRPLAPGAVGTFPGGAETYAAAGGSAGPSRPAQPEVSARRRGGRAGAAGEEAGLGHLPGTEAGAALLEMSSPCSQPRSRCGVGGGRGRGPGPEPGPGRRWGLGSSLPRGASQLLLPLSREAAALRLRASYPSPRRGLGEPDGIPRLPSPKTAVVSVSPWPAALPGLAPYPGSMQQLPFKLEGAFRRGRRALPPASGLPFGVRRPVQGAWVPTHPVAVSFTSIGAEAPVPCDVLLSCVCCILPTW